MLMKSYICEFSRLSWCENSLLEFGCDVHCLYGCVSVWKSEIGVCGYQCKYIVYIISFYCFVFVITVQVPFQAGG